MAKKGKTSDGHDVHVITEIRPCRVDVSDDEKIIIADELITCISRIEDLEEELKKIKKQFKDDIDEQIAKETHSYEFKRIYSIERNILRLGVYEMLYDDQVPPKVAIAEAMRLGKKFGTPASVAFINAIMDHLYKLDQGESPDPQEVTKTLTELVEDDKELPHPDEQEFE